MNWHHFANSVGDGAPWFFGGVVLTAAYYRLRGYRIRVDKP